MIKKIVSISFSILLILISFLYTNSVMRNSRSNDPIMKTIMRDKSLYEKEVVECLVEGNTIIPGVDGLKIDIDNSYSNMKKVGKFDKNLFVFSTIKPELDINYIYDKYLVSGNSKLNNVSILVIVNNPSYLEDILKILNSNNINATFFLSKSIFDNNIDLVKLVASFGNDIELLSDNYTIFEVNKYNSILKLITEDKLSFCYSETNNEELLNNCNDSKLIPVIPSIKTDNYIYGIIKDKVSNGSIISIKSNKNTVDELKSSINYIYQKGKKIILLKKLFN